ncbi:unnamed protein product [Lymnaea stagnalis]|uniref:C2H2-type domain-containing protein n=1 Tax=Lymnaea stagnalis TaxID=6523 RepID=A0AAV2I2X3_LYMST
MPSYNQQSQLIKHIISRIKANNVEISPPGHDSEAALGSSERETETLHKLKQSWSCFKALFVKEIKSKSQTKSAFILALENICCKDGLGVTGEELDKFDDFLVTFEDICLPILFLVYERFRFYSYKFCDAGSKKSNEEVISAMITLSSFCGINWMPLTYFKQIIRESIGIDETVKRGLILFLSAAGGRKFLDDTGIREPSNSKLYGHRTPFKVKSETGNDFVNGEIGNNNKFISISAPKIYEDDLLTSDKLVENKSTFQESGRAFVTETGEYTAAREQDDSLSFTKTLTHRSQNEPGALAQVKLKLIGSPEDCTWPVCGKPSAKKNIKKHLKTHVSEGKYSCPRCSLTFKFKHFFNAHLKSHIHDDNEANKIEKNNHKVPLSPSLNICQKSKCADGQKGSLGLFKGGASSVCDEKFPMSSMYKAPHKLLSQVFQCEICQAQFKGAAKLKRHSLTHTGEKPFKCHCCQTPFADRSHLNVHLRVHSGEKPFRCQWCAANFSESTKLKNHVRTHTGEKPFVCEICGVMFSVSSSLKSHKKTHTNNKPFKCEICNFSTAHSSNLKAHLKLHLGEKKFTCDTCGASFLETAKLKRHRMVHTGEQPYSCEVCGKRFADKSHLTVHLRIHSGDKPFKCTHRGCASAFVESSKLKNHMRRHTGEKPYICEVCGTSFAVPYSLKSHMRRHTGEKPYKCTLCNYASSQSSNLKTHMSVHNGSRPHSCTICVASFSELSKLKRHMVVHRDVGESENAALISDSSQKSELLMNGDISFNRLVAENHHVESYLFKNHPEQQRKPGCDRETHFKPSDTDHSGQDLCEPTTDSGQFEKDQSYLFQKGSSLHLYQLVSQPATGNANSQISANDLHPPYLGDQNLIARSGDHSTAGGSQQLVMGQHIKDIEVSVLYNSALYKSAYFQESAVHLELGHL